MERVQQSMGMADEALTVKNSETRQIGRASIELVHFLPTTRRQSLVLYLQCNRLISPPMSRISLGLMYTFLLLAGRFISPFTYQQMSVDIFYFRVCMEQIAISFFDTQASFSSSRENDMQWIGYLSFSLLELCSRVFLRKKRLKLLTYSPRRKSIRVMVPLISFVTRYLPLKLWAKPITSLQNFTFRIHWPVLMLQTLRVLSAEQDTAKSGFLVNSTLQTSDLCPIITRTGAGVSVFHSLIDLSADELIKQYPDSLKFTDQTILLWDLKFNRRILVRRHHSLMTRSVAAERRKNQSWERDIAVTFPSCPMNLKSSCNSLGVFSGLPLGFSFSFSFSLLSPSLPSSSIIISSSPTIPLKAGFESFKVLRSHHSIVLEFETSIPLPVIMCVPSTVSRRTPLFGAVKLLP